MRNTVLVVAAALLLPVCAFAVDGVALINQSTVMAAGGFPYVISSPGSYKLSGNLTVTTSATGNTGAFQTVAILISASGVSLDLNGFSITVNNSFNIAGHIFNAIAESGALQQVKISNGMITLNSGNLSNLAGPTYAIYFPSSTYCTFENLSITARFTFRGGGIQSNTESSIRRNVFNVDSPGSGCPSLWIENVGVDEVQLNAAGCRAVNNIP